MKYGKTRGMAALGVLLTALAAVAARGEVAAKAPEVSSVAPVEELGETKLEVHRRWFIHAGLVNAYPYMKSEALIRRFYDPIMKGIAPGHDKVNTVGDLRDAHLLLPPQIGWGVNLSKRWSFSMQGGWAEGTVRTQQDNTSILFLIPWHEDFKIRRGAYYLGAGFDFFPFGMCEQRDYKGFVDRFKGIRPFIGESVTVTDASYHAHAQLGLKGLPNIGVQLKDRWVLPNLNIHVGLDFPINERGAISVNAGFNRFWEQTNDFQGWAISWEYKYLFR